MLETILTAFKNYRTPIVAVLIIVGALACFFYGAHVERLEANEEIALMEKEYANRESAALYEADELRKHQEQKFLEEMDRLRAINADISLDAIRVREQFDKLQSGRDSNNQSSDHRADRCNGLLSEAYSLASEGEGLLRERDARLNAVK